MQARLFLEHLLKHLLHQNIPLENVNTDKQHPGAFHFNEASYSEVTGSKPCNFLKTIYVQVQNKTVRKRLGDWSISGKNYKLEIQSILFSN